MLKITFNTYDYHFFLYTFSLGINTFPNNNVSRIKTIYLNEVHFTVLLIVDLSYSIP